MGWGIFAGSTAKTALKTYTTLTDEDRQDNADERAGNADKRAASAEGRAAGNYAYEQGERSKDKAFLDELAGGAPSKIDAPVVTEAPAAEQPAPKPSERMNLGGPKGVTPAEDEATETARAVTAKASAIPALKKTVVADNSGGQGLSMSQRAEAAFKKTRSAAGYEAMLKAKNQESVDAERQSAIRDRDSVVRSRDQATSHADVEFMKVRAADEATKTAATAEAWRDTPDDIQLTADPETTKAVFNGLESTYKKVLDGNHAEWNMSDKGVNVKVINTKTGKVQSDLNYATVGQAKQVVRQLGLLTSPEQYGKYVGASNFDALNAKLTKSETALKLANSENRVQAAKMLGEVNEILNGGPASMLDNEGKLKELAHRMEMLAPESVRVKVGSEEVTDPETGTKTKRDVYGNSVIENLRMMGPKTSVAVLDKDKNKGELNIRQAIPKVAETYPEVLKKANYNVEAANKELVSELKAYGFEPDVIEWAMPKIHEIYMKELPGKLYGSAAPASMTQGMGGWRGGASRNVSK